MPASGCSCPSPRKGSRAARAVPWELIFAFFVGIYDYFQPNDNEVDVSVSSTPQPEETTQSEQTASSVETGYALSTPQPKEIVSGNPQLQNTNTIRMVLSLPMTIDTFNYEVQTAFKDALAQAAGVASNAVSIDSIVAGIQRRLLSDSVIV